MATGRAVLGAADVTDARLAEMVATARGVASVELLTSTAEVVDYDLDALTTAGRFWVHGTARDAGDSSSYRFFVKVVQSWERSPVFAFVPESMRAEALAQIPWERESQVYRSDLHDRLPPGLRMPRAYAVEDLDECSAAIWLQAVEALDSTAVRWDTARFANAAYRLGRLAASRRVAPIGELSDITNLPRAYARGRLGHQVLPALRSEEVWTHPLVAATFDPELRADLVAAADAMPGYLDELDRMPVGTIHGDACTRNLLVTAEDPDGFVLIDYGFWGRGPVGFDLGQLLVGEVQTGDRPAAGLGTIEQACVPAYVRGLRDEGCAIGEDVVRRAHALLTLEFCGLSSLPLELLDQAPTPELIAYSCERAALARFVLDLVEATD